MSKITNTCSSQFIHIAPRIAALAGTLFVAGALVALAGQHLSVLGTTAQVTSTFTSNCLNIAKWSAIVVGGSVAVSLVKDLAFYAISKQRKEGYPLKYHVIISLLSPLGSQIWLDR